MAAIKTRIWQGGLASITGNPAHAVETVNELARASTVVEGQTTLVGIAPHEALDSVPDPAQAGPAAAPPHMAATRIMPIEELLGPGGLSALSAPLRDHATPAPE